MAPGIPSGLWEEKTEKAEVKMSPKKKFALTLVAIPIILNPVGLLIVGGIGVLIVIAMFLSALADMCGIKVYSFFEKQGIRFKNFCSRRKASSEVKAIYKSAKKIRRGRKVPPILLEKLEESILQFPVVENEYAACLNEEAAQEMVLSRISTDIEVLCAKRDAAHDESVRQSYDQLISELTPAKVEQEGRYRSARNAYISCHWKRIDMLNLFRNAKEVARDFEEHGEVSQKILEHQSEIVGLLEHRRR
jgi:hypothetical protein